MWVNYIPHHLFWRGSKISFYILYFLVYDSKHKHLPWQVCGRSRINKSNRLIHMKSVWVYLFVLFCYPNTDHHFSRCPLLSFSASNLEIKHKNQSKQMPHLAVWVSVFCVSSKVLAFRWVKKWLRSYLLTLNCTTVRYWSKDNGASSHVRIKGSTTDHLCKFWLCSFHISDAYSSCIKWESLVGQPLSVLLAFRLYNF